jgi:hypothetical protein
LDQLYDWWRTPGYAVPAPATTSYRQLLNWLSAATARHGKLLLVLDGLDRVQNAASDSGSVGRIVDIPLQTLVVDAADGLLGVAVLITGASSSWNKLGRGVRRFAALTLPALVESLGGLTSCR